MIPNPFLMFLRAYWLQIIIAMAGLILLAYISVLKIQNNALKRDNASLQAIIASIPALGKAQDEKSDRIEQGSRKAAEIITSQYQSDLQKVKDYYAKNPVIKYKPNRVCNTTTDNRTSQVPTTDTSTQGVDAGTTNEISANPDIERDCTITTLMLLKLQEFETKQQEVQ